MKKSISEKWSLVVIGAALLGVGMVEAPEYDDLVPMKPTQVNEQKLTHKEVALAKFFIKEQCHNPVELARVVAKMKHPRLAASQAVIKSRGDIEAVGSVGERGVWQMIEAEFGEVPDDLQGQADKYEWAIAEMIQENHGDLRKALFRYNHSSEYVNKVMAKVATIKL